MNEKTISFLFFTRNSNLRQIKKYIIYNILDKKGTLNTKENARKKNHIFFQIDK